MKSHRRLMLLLLPCLTVGCEQLSVIPLFPTAPVEQPLRWSRAAANYDDFLKTRFFCLDTARYPDGLFRQDVFFPCMHARGFREDPYGPFWAPPGARL